MICGKSRKNSEKPPSVILYWRSDVGIMRPSFISMQESCKHPGFLVDLCSAYRIKDTAPDWQRTGGKSYQISGTVPETTALNTCAASFLQLLRFCQRRKNPRLKWRQRSALTLVLQFCLSYKSPFLIEKGGKVPARNWFI